MCTEIASIPKCLRCRKIWKNCTHSFDVDDVQNAATGIFLRFPTRTAQNRKLSQMINVDGRSWSTSRSSNRSNGASISVITASTTSINLSPTTLGMVSNLMLSGFGSEFIRVSHSCVTTKVTRMLGLLETSNLLKFIIGFMCPLDGYGTTNTWLMVRVLGDCGSWSWNSMIMEFEGMVVVLVWFCVVRVDEFVYECVVY